MVVGIIWLWGTMLVAIVYPLVDGGIEQINQIYRGLTGRGDPRVHENSVKDAGDTTTSPSSPSATSISEGAQDKNEAN